MKIQLLLIQDLVPHRRLRGTSPCESRREAISPCRLLHLAGPAPGAQCGRGPGTVSGSGTDRVAGPVKPGRLPRSPASARRARTPLPLPPAAGQGPRLGPSRVSTPFYFWDLISTRFFKRAILGCFLFLTRSVPSAAPALETPSTVTESSLVLGPGALPPAHAVGGGLPASPDPRIPLNFYSGVGEAHT